MTFQEIMPMTTDMNSGKLDSQKTPGQPTSANISSPTSAGDASATSHLHEAPPLNTVQHAGEPRRWSVLSWFTRAIPTCLVIIALIGLGYFGHHYGWTIPKFSELTHQGGPATLVWCEEHNVPEEICIACNADLMPKDTLYGWCKEHGVHECVLHHPELVQLDATPDITPADFDRAARALALRPRTQNDPGCKMHLRRIQFPSRAAADKAGIDINLVDRAPVVESLSTSGEIIYNPTLVARLASRTAGSVRHVVANVGDRVSQGDVVAIIDAVDVGRVKSELIQAAFQLHLRKETYNRLTGLGTVVAGKRVLEAETSVAEAGVAVQKMVQTLANFGMPIAYDDVLQLSTDQLRRKLQFLGLPDKLVQQIDATGATSNLVPIVAPRDGVVVARDIVAGEVIDTQKTLFTIADTSRMWLVLSVPLEQVEYVELGQKVTFRPDGSDVTNTGALTWLSTDVDTDTRTVKVRGELPNDDGNLRNETFGVGEIILRDEPAGIVVASSAVHWEGCCHVVFVRDKDYMKDDAFKVFHTRSVRPGVAMGETTEMIAGLWPGEVVVTRGSGVLRAELLKGNLGAG